MKATQLTKDELDAIAKLQAEAEEKRKLAEEKRKQRERKKRYERAEKQRQRGPCRSSP